MVKNIEEAHGQYLRALHDSAAWFADHVKRMGRQHHLWNSPEQFTLRDKLEYLRGMEDTLGLTEEEANQERSAVGLPERRKTAVR